MEAPRAAARTPRSAPIMAAPQLLLEGQPRLVHRGRDARRELPSHGIRDLGDRRAVELVALDAERLAERRRQVENRDFAREPARRYAGAGSDEEARLRVLAGPAIRVLAVDAADPRRPDGTNGFRADPFDEKIGEVPGVLAFEQVRLSKHA